MTNLTPGSPGFVERLLADRIGLDVASVGLGLIVRGVQIRMTQLGVRRQEDYERILLSHDDEVQALIEEVVIPESWFFRDLKPFVTFRDFVRAEWVNEPLRSPLSVLCLPCASGEEPYSVVIALLELGLASERFTVTAVDISERSIRRAAAGLYSINAFRGMDPELQSRYFLAHQSRFLLKASIRSMVRFERGNILDLTLLKAQGGFDVVFCRNLLIYFDDEAKRRAFANLDRLTTVGGLLFLGHADRPDQDGASRFHSYADRGSFAYRKQSQSSRQTVVLPPQATKLGPSSNSVSSQGNPAPRLPERPAPAATASTPVVRPADPIPRPTIDYNEAMTQASVLADQGRYFEATKLVEAHMGRGSLDAGAHFLLGIIHQAAGNRVAAEAELSKAIYLNPDHDEALLALALLARRKGDMAAEAVYRRRADRVLARKGRP